MTDKTLFERAPCGYLLLDEAWGVVRANAAFLQLVGRTAEQVVGRLSFPDLVTMGGRLYCETHLIPALELHRELHEVALEVVTSGGERIPVLVSANRAAGIVRLVVFEARHRRDYEKNLLQLTREADTARSAATHLATTLQRTLIPPSLPHVPGLGLAAAYRPAGDGSVVGGDFYDVFQVAPHDWIVVIGDVEGKGATSAAVTAFVRHQLRALTMQSHDPATVLEGLNKVMLTHEARHFCTLALVRVQSRDGRWRALTSLAGHPRPLLRAPDGDVREIGVPGSIVGIFDTAQFTTVEDDLADTMLTLFTDGVTEARSAGDVYGEERLFRLIREHPSRDPQRLTASIIDDVLTYQEGQAADDIAVLTVAASGTTQED